MPAIELACFAAIVFLAGIAIGASWSAAASQRRIDKTERKSGDLSTNEPVDPVMEAMLANARDSIYARRRPAAEVVEDAETIRSR